MTHVHLIGIGGTGLSAIATVLVEKGYTVSGSDRALSPLAQNLMAHGIQVHIGQRAENVRGADLVVRSSAVTDDNPEVQAARSLGIPVLKRSDFLGELTGDSRVIAIGGTHGKTTTTSMIAWMLSQMNQDPSYIIGGVSQNLGKNAHAGHGTHFVIEADEYDRMFLGLKPEVIVLTIIEHDHPDCYPTPAEYRQAFVDFSERLAADGLLIASADDPGAADILAHAQSAGKRVISYGITSPADYQAVNLAPKTGSGYAFEALANGKPLAAVQLQVPGIHNVRNALAALAVADQLGLPVVEAAQALAEFKGTGRRFEIRGESGGVILVDDYAHHPTEIRATLAAAHSRYPASRIWAVWQPHTYSRTQTLFAEFVQALQGADQVIVTEVYAAREPKSDFSAAQIVAALHNPQAHFAATLSAATDLLVEHVQPGDVVLVLSAGDADQITSAVLTRLNERSTQNG